MDLSALVSAGAVFVDLLGAVSYPVYVEKDAAAHKCSSAGGQHRLRRQYDTLSAYQCLHDCLLCADGLYDGFDDPDDGKLSAQHASARCSQAGTVVA